METIENNNTIIRQDFSIFTKQQGFGLEFWISGEVSMLSGVKSRGVRWW